MRTNSSMASIERHGFMYLQKDDRESFRVCFSNPAFLIYGELLGCILQLLSSTDIMGSNKLTVKSKGIYHGLPTYPESLKGLRAIVTGANGISGYHLVRVLSAAPERWSKIYCLSRRPPPENFYTDLGDGASRVEHINVDFLGDPAKVAEALSKIDRVEYAFFFSYTQPAQKGGVLGMWSEADELAKTNSQLLDTFLGGLKQSGLKPKRILLQTGAKHYGFHMGPATSPSFESDPRITLETNFYYPQEDSLFKYCKDNGCQWNVVRPSYIIGAVRDGLLNHMIGISIYASVRAYLKQKLHYPGDGIGWDREHCQSTGILNSYFHEWCVLTDKTGDEAFNIQDGLPFTWGRFWAYLADWYGLEWTPPDPDQSKYRSMESRHKTPPRGYGDPGITYSTFSLQEWAEEPEVAKAWTEMTKEHGLVLNPFESAEKRAQVFGVSDSAIVGGWPLSLSMRKARKLGWHGTVDSYEAAFKTIHDLARLKLTVAPPMKEFKE